MKRITIILTTLIAALSASSTQAQEVIELNKQQFLEKVWNYEVDTDTWKYNGTLPCIIDFNAKWCGPCRRMEPILKDMAKKYEGQIIIYKVDVDKEQELASFFRIKSIPAFMFCPLEGKPRGAKGAYPAEDFEKFIKEVLLKE